jgi:hypothetical protein
MARWLIFAVTVVLSSGWTVPLYFSFQFLHSWCRLEAAPVVYKTEPSANSFPFLAESERLWFIAITWLAAVALFWSVVGASRLFPKRLDTPA